MNPNPYFYEILGVETTASDKDIEKSYRKLRRKHRAAVNPKDTAAFKLWQITKAFDVLSNAEQRRCYDDRFEDAYNSSGLHAPLWAVTDAKIRFITDLTYDEAARQITDYPSATIVTAATAARMVTN
ncbi:MAG: DnaJ domain-containing protein [Pyrinomonadaceae bacterium]|nr:DnaJ domain-containing protein [Pyrinomonadaceae bacterium]